MVLGASEVSANLYCNSRISVLERLHDYLQLLMKRSVLIELTSGVYIVIGSFHPQRNFLTVFDEIFSSLFLFFPALSFPIFQAATSSPPNTIYPSLTLVVNEDVQMLDYDCFWH